MTKRRDGETDAVKSDGRTACTVCGLRHSDCICCESCGHVCPLDRGEPWCPVCKPEVKVKEH